jgi:hypothetical protein
MGYQLVAEATTYMTLNKYMRNIHVLSKIWTRDLGNQAASDLCPRLQSHWDQAINYYGLELDSVGYLWSLSVGSSVVAE